MGRTSQLSRGSLVVFGVSAFFAAVQLRLIVFILGDGLTQSAEAAHGVLEGRPHWRAFQNRILAPYVIESLRHVVGNDNVAHGLFMGGCLTIAGVIAYMMGRQLANRSGGALAFAVFQLGFAALLSPPWLYAWDFVGVIIFLLFVSFVALERPVWWFVGLFAVAIFNRESAQFIALWLILDPITRYAFDRFTGRTGTRFNVVSVVAGVGCLLAGMAIVEFLRASLLIEEIGPQLVGHRLPNDVVSFVKRRVLTNIYWIQRSFTDPGSYEVAVIPLLLVALFGLSIALVLRRPREMLGLALVNVAMMGALFTLGHLPESRIYLDLVPFMTLCTVILAGPADGVFLSDCVTPVDATRQVPARG